MQLPDDIVRLIREYSRPLTRPDWKRLRKLPHDEFGIQLFIGTRSRLPRNKLCMQTFEKACVVLQERQPVRVPVIPQFCAFHGNGCTTQSKTKRRCSKCSTQVCMSCKHCPLHK